jgi:hypothetical protein
MYLEPGLAVSPGSTEGGPLNTNPIQIVCFYLQMIHFGFFSCQNIRENVPCCCFSFLYLPTSANILQKSRKFLQAALRFHVNEIFRTKANFQQQLTIYKKRRVGTVFLQNFLRQESIFIFSSSVFQRFEIPKEYR